VENAFGIDSPVSFIPLMTLGTSDDPGFLDDPGFQ
jgi:hypothetical protein